MNKKAYDKRLAQFQVDLGQRVKEKIIDELGYKSLDAFSLEHHDLVTKKTLYDLCAGQRDIKLSTLIGLSVALEANPEELINELFKAK